MKTINKGNGTGSGDSVKQALLKTADNFIETDSRLLDLERSYPRKLRGWAPPTPGFPQIPSAKGSKWTGAARVGSATFASPTASAGIIPMPSGKILAFGGVNTTTGYLQLYAVSETGALTALGTPYTIPNATTLLSASAIGPDLLCLICSNSSSGTSLQRVILSASAAGLTQVSVTVFGVTVLSSYNFRGGRTPNTAFMPAGLLSASASAASVGALQVSALPAESGCRFPASTSRYGTTRIPISHDMLAADAMVMLVEQTQIDGSVGVAAVLMSGTDKAIQSIDILPLAAGAAGVNISALALTSTRALLKGSPTQGVFVVNIVDGEISLLSHDVQTAGILARLWRAVVQQDASRGLVFEQAADSTLPTVIEIDPVTGAISEGGTVPLVFGTSGTASPMDAVKIGANRVVVIGRSATTSPACLIEVWDLS